MERAAAEGPTIGKTETKGKENSTVLCIESSHDEFGLFEKIPLLVEV